MNEGFGYQANLQRGQMLRQSGRQEDACRFFGEAIQADPEQPQAYLELALAQSELPKRQDDSLRSVDRALGLAPHSAYFLGYKAYLLSHFGRHKEGLEIAKQSLQIDPECYIALLAQANAYTKLSKWDQAEAFSRRMLALYPGNISALNLLAQSLRFQNRHRESRHVVAQILALVPNDAFGHTNAGYEALKVNDRPQAWDHFRNALRCDPHLEHARKGLLQTLRLHSWFYRLNFKILTFFGPDRKAERIARSCLVLLCIFTGGLFLGLIFLYLIIGLTLQPLSNLFLLINPEARHAYSPREWRRALCTAGVTLLLLVALACAGLFKTLLVVAAYLCLFALSFYAPQSTEASGRN
jgi:tetratricopeptide (TPR) repeat protein